MRKESFVTIPDDPPGNRDAGKMFKITEMPASAAELWAMRALQAIARADVDIPEAVRGSGIAGIAYMGLRGFGKLPFEDLRELMDEMFQCVQVCRTKDQNVCSPVIEADIEEVSTRMYLRERIFELHTGFSFAGEKRTSTSSSAPTASNQSSTQT
jgi:hypothetical protein